MNNQKAPLSTNLENPRISSDAKAKNLVELESRHIVQTYKRLPVVMERGKGVYLYDTSGSEYLDFVAGIAVDALGHSHPKWVQAISDQASRLVHTSNVVYTEPGIRLASKLCEKASMDRVFFCNSGTEAVEASIKIARKWGKKKRGDSCYKIISFERGFHGRTFGALSATANNKYKAPFAPLVPGFTELKFDQKNELEAALDGSVCAIIIEVVQGEAGVYVNDSDYLKFLRKLCDEKEVLLIVDEIQSGIARTGKYFAFQYSGIKPDLVTLAKGLGGGFPIGACLASGEAATTLEHGEHGSTYAGNPLAATAALTVLDVIENENLLKNVEQSGDVLKQGLEKLCTKYPFLDHVRGLGLICALEFKEPKARNVVAQGLDNGLLLNATSDTTLRFVPPLIISSSEIIEGLKRLDNTLQKV